MEAYHLLEPTYSTRSYLKPNVGMLTVKSNGLENFAKKILRILSNQNKTKGGPLQLNQFPQHVIQWMSCMNHHTHLPSSPLPFIRVFTNTSKLIVKLLNSFNTVILFWHNILLHVVTLYIEDVSGVQHMLMFDMDTCDYISCLQFS